VIDNEIDERAVNLPRSAPIRPDPPRSDASWRKISVRSALPKSTGTVFERQLSAAAAAAGGPIATAALRYPAPNNRSTITKTRTRIRDISFNN